MAVPVHNHGPDYHPELRLIHTGVSEHTLRFREWLQEQDIPINVNIHSAIACCYFLVEERGYELINHQMEPCVMYGGQPITSCYVDGPQGPNGKYGVVKTPHSHHLGAPTIRPVCKSHSYQFYGPAPAALALGQNLTARLEAIAVTQLTGQEELSGCYFSYADAALLEVYRKGKDEGSLGGKVSHQQGEMKKEVQDEEEVEDESEDLSKGVSELKLQ